MCWTGAAHWGRPGEHRRACTHSCSSLCHAEPMLGAHGCHWCSQPSCHSPAKPWGSCWTGWTGQPGSASDTMPQLGSASHPPAHLNLPFHHCSGCWTSSQGPSLFPTAQGQLCHAVGWAVPSAGLHSLPWAARSCPGLSEPDMTSGSCPRSVLEGFRSGHPSVGEERTPLLCPSG